MSHLFPGQQDDERIFLIVRQHWFFLLIRLFVVLLLFIILLVFRAYGPNLAPFLFTDTIAGNVVHILSQLYILALVVAVFLLWVFYYLNIQIITNLRIVDINQQGLFSRRISELHMDKIEDVTSEAHGMLATIFQFGSVYVQTAGTVDRFEFERVPAPEQIEKLILDLYERRPRRPLNPQSQPPHIL